MKKPGTVRLGYALMMTGAVLTIISLVSCARMFPDVIMQKKEPTLPLTLATLLGGLFLWRIGTWIKRR
jgi:hypothetical protein